MPESPSGFEDLTVTELIRLSALSHGLSDDKQKKSVATVLEELQLEPISGLRLADLSKGLRQRVWLAQALVHNPEILFLDEPTDGLDPIQKVALRRYILKLREKNCDNVDPYFGGGRSYVRAHIGYE